MVMRVRSDLVFHFNGFNRLLNGTDRAGNRASGRPGWGGSGEGGAKIEGEGAKGWDLQTLVDEIEPGVM